MAQPYLSLEAEWHDLFWAAEDAGSELLLMADFLRAHPGRALEIGSGSGRLLLPLRQEGFAIEGLELSADMRRLAEDRARELGLSAIIHSGDMEQWQPAAPYDALLVPAFSLQLAADPAATLRHWHQHLLRPGGGLYLTLFIPFGELLGELPEGRWYPDHSATLADGRTAQIETRHHLDRSRQRLTREHKYRIRGNPEVLHACRQELCWFEHAQAAQLLESCGFTLERHLLDFDPRHTHPDPGPDDFGGIITYLARAQTKAKGR